MKINKSKLTQIIREEIEQLAAESYASAAATYGSNPFPKDKLRFGKGLTSSSATAGDDKYPNWFHVNKAFNVIFEEMSVIHNSSKSFQQDKRLLALIYMVRDFIKKNPYLGLEEVMYRHTEEMWESAMKMGKYLSNNIPNYIKKFRPETYEKITTLAKFIQDVAGARWGSMSVGYSLKGLEQDLEIPPELR